MKTFDEHSWKILAQISEVSFTSMTVEAQLKRTLYFQAPMISHESRRKYLEMTYLVSKFSILASFVFTIWLSFRISRLVS